MWTKKSISGGWFGHMIQAILKITDTSQNNLMLFNFKKLFFIYTYEYLPVPPPKKKLSGIIFETLKDLSKQKKFDFLKMQK